MQTKRKKRTIVSGGKNDVVYDCVEYENEYFTGLKALVEEPKKYSSLFDQPLLESAKRVGVATW